MMRNKLLIILLICIIILVIFGIYLLTQAPIQELPKQQEDEKHEGFEELEEYLEFTGCENIILEKTTPAVKVPSGYRVSYFIAPNNLSTPSDIVFDSKGDLYVVEIRGNGISKVSPDGEIEYWAKMDGSFYGLAVDKNDTFYSYNFPRGEIFKITKDGKVSLLIQDFDKLGCYLESTIAVNSKGEIFVIRNSDETNRGSLQQITPDGRIKTVITDIDKLEAIDFNSKDELFATRLNEIIKIDIKTGGIELIKKVEDVETFSSHGLVFDTDDIMYVTSDDAIYKMDEIGIHMIAKGFTGLQGIAIKRGGEIFVVSRDYNAIYKITDKIECIVLPTPLTTPQAMAFNDKDELFITNGEVGFIVKYSIQGEALERYEGVVYGPPWEDFVIDKDGSIILAESAPGFTDRVIRIPEGSTDEDDPRRVELGRFSKPAGVAIWEGEIYVAEHEKGTIIKVTEDGKKEEFVRIDALLGAMTFDGQGNLWVVSGEGLYKVTPEKKIKLVYKDSGLIFVVADSENNVFVSQGTEVLKVSDEEVSTFISGLKSAMGLSFDREGNLYVADDVLNAVIKVEKE